MSIVTDEIKRLSIEEEVSKYLRIETDSEMSIEWGMNHITFAPSKRVRPLLVYEANLAFGQIDCDTAVLASVVEAIHTYSLVHDDLPCMDDAGFRRGVKTLHTFKDEAYALLVGDALLTHGYSVLANYTKPANFAKILALVGSKAGKDGMILGQTLDVEAEAFVLTVEDVSKINLYKTGALLQLSLMLGAINAGATEAQVEKMELLGALIGDVFQIQDDILDIVGDSATLGKPVGSDEKNEKSSIPAIVGIEKARQIMGEKAEHARLIVDSLPENKEFFYGFLKFLVERSA